MNDNINHWRQCVFCGAKPERKNKEHVVPIWLQEFTGNQDRPAYLPTPSGDIKLTWSNLVLPACSQCNQTFGVLEEIAKDAMHRIEEGEVTANDMMMLLDWMDKIRVGVWRLQLAHGKNNHSITPNYSITKRLRKADRLVRVFKYRTDAKGIGLIGIDTEAFIRMPSAFALIVKDIVILSVSAGGVLQERMGLAKYRELVNDDAGKGYFVAERQDAFNKSWGSDLFRFNQQRFFSFYSLNASTRFADNDLFSDANGQLEKLYITDRFCVPTVETYTPLLKPLITLEVYEIQRLLLQLYSRFELSNEFRLALSQTYRKLDRDIDQVAEWHDSISPLPTFRRDYLRWLQ